MEDKKKHRHKWELEYDDCMRCGGAEYFMCSCGEMRELDKKTPL